MRDKNSGVLRAKNSKGFTNGAIISVFTLSQLLSLVFLHADPAPAVPALDTSAYTKLLQKPATLDEAEKQARQLMLAMTPEEKFSYVCGAGTGIEPQPRLGIPAIKLGDASCGLRIPAKDSRVTTTAFPCTMTVAATWDPELAQDYAKSIAEEFRVFGVHFILGPGQNLYRNSQCGRNFEYVGEDPYLAGQMVSAYVHGAQSVGVATTLKHFIGNETDYYRRSTNTIVSDRALHELYLAPFKAGVEAGAVGVMSSYNLVNGEWAGENHHLITDILRHELGFKGLVMTDWGSTFHGDKLAQSGVDLEMPDGHALKYDKAKVLGTPEIDEMVVDILKTCIFFGLYEEELNHEYKKPEWKSKYPQHEEIARRVNEEGIVLLKNNGLLPLSVNPASGKVLVTGNFANLKELSGGGSSEVVGYNLNTYLAAVQDIYGAGNVVHANIPTDDQIKEASVVLIFTGRPLDWALVKSIKIPYRQIEGESNDHPFILPQDDLIAHCATLNPNTVVNIVSGCGAQMDWVDKPAAIIQAFFGGQTGADALLDILTGKVNPSGKLPMTIEKHFEDSCAADYLKDAKPQANIADPVDMNKRVVKIIGGVWLDDASTKVFTYDVNYKEGIFMGYRWYDEKNIEPRFPFGFGLSYTTFEYDNGSLAAQEVAVGTPVTVNFTVKNTGQRAGTEVAEVYVSEKQPTVPRPLRELKGFQRVALDPGESKMVSVQIAPEAFSYYDETSHGWKTDTGAFDIEVGASSRDIRLTQTVTLR